MQTVEAGRVLGRVVRVPVQIRSVRAFSATFAVDRAAAARLLPASSGLSLVGLGKRALLSVAALDYLDGDWGAYREVALTFVVRSESGATGIYLHKLPVSEAFTCEAGRRIYGFPKWVAGIDISERRGARSCALWSDGALVLSLDVRGHGRFAFGPVSVDAFAFADGTLRKCRFTMSGAGLGVRPLGAHITLGSHELAAELRALGLPRRPIAATVIERMRAEFGPPELPRTAQGESCSARPF